MGRQLFLYHLLLFWFSTSYIHIWKHINILIHSIISKFTLGELTIDWPWALGSLPAHPIWVNSIIWKSKSIFSPNLGTSIWFMQLIWENRSYYDKMPLRPIPRFKNYSIAIGSKFNHFTLFGVFTPKLHWADTFYTNNCTYCCNKIYWSTLLSIQWV